MTVAATLGGSLAEIRPGRTVYLARHDAGSATTLFFVHGGGGNKEQWRFQWRHFAGDAVNLVAWDAVGHGASPQPKDPAAYLGAALVADAEVVFARYRTARNIVVAHSYGARLVLAWLSSDQKAREAVEALVLLGAAPLGQMGGRLIPGWFGKLPLPVLELARPLLSRAFRKRAWGAGADPALVAAEQRATRGNTLAMMQALLAGAPIVDTAALRMLTQKTLVLAGESDGLIPAAASAKLAGLLPNATLQIVPGCGHQIMLEAPDVTNRAITSALAAPVAASA